MAAAGYSNLVSVVVIRWSLTRSRFSAAALINLWELRTADCT